MPVTLFPGTPGGATPGTITPADPGSTFSGGGGGGGGGFIVNQWTQSASNDYGLQIVPVQNTLTHAMVAFIGWNSNGLATGAIPFVADDAHNWWVPVAVLASNSGETGGAIWATANAKPANYVSVSTSRPTLGICINIVEMSGIGNFVVSDAGILNTFQGNTSGSATLTGTAAQADVFFSMLVGDDNSDAVTDPSTPWNALTNVSQNDPNGIGGLGDTSISPVYYQGGLGAVSAAWNWTGSMAATGILAGIIFGAPAPAQSNPNWPVLKVEAAFGFAPGNPVQPLLWTDITNRAINEDGQGILSASRGRAYELTSPEAGTLKVFLNNQDGFLNPTNTTSTFYPNVRPGVPLRVSAVWSNRTYAVGYGFVDRWPQTFPTSQWGFSEVQASDTMGVLANLNMFSAYQSEVLLDSPYAYWPLAEDYSQALGLPFNNVAPGNYHPLLGLYGLSSSAANQVLQCGLALNLNGDTGTGVGISGMTVEPPIWSAGALNVDPATPWPVGSGNSITVEFWANMSPNTTALGNGSYDYTVPLVSLLGQSSNYPANAGQVRFSAGVKWVSSSSTSTAYVVMGDFVGDSHIDNSTWNAPVDGNTHHHVYVLTWNGSAFTAAHYLDGAKDPGTVTFTSVTNSDDIYQVVAGPAFISPGLNIRPFDYVVGHVAIYNGALSKQRISAHYQAGANGWTGDTVLERFTRIMAYSMSGVSRAGSAGSASPLFGYADTLQGQAALDSLNDLAVTEGGQPYADAAGNTWYLGRADLYDLTPKWTLGDHVSAGETPYLPDAAFDYDNTYIYNQLIMQRQISQSESVTTNPAQGALIQQFSDLGAEAIVADTTSEQEYFLRNSLQQTVYAASDEDVYDKANWTLNKYKQPALRLPKVTLDPASHPNVWPVALGIEQGDIIQVTRRPVGGSPYVVLGVVQQIEHKVGPNKWQTTLSIAPYTIEASILNVGNSGYDTLAEGLGW